MSQNRAIASSDKLSRKGLMLRLGLLLSILTLLLMPSFAATAAHAATAPNAESLSSQRVLNDVDEPGVIELEVVVPEPTQQPSTKPSPAVSPLPDDANALPGTGADLAYLWILALIGSAAAVVGAVFWSKARRRAKLDAQ